MPNTSARGIPYMDGDDKASTLAASVKVTVDYIDGQLTEIDTKREYLKAVNTTPNTIVADSSFRPSTGWTTARESGDFVYSGGGVWTYQGSTTRLVEANAHMAFLGDGTGQRVMQILRNGSSVDECAAPSAPTNVSTHLRARYSGVANPGDTFAVVLFVSTGAGNQAPEANSTKNQFDIQTVD